MELTALHLAVIGESIECLRLLRQYHAPIDAADRVGFMKTANGAAYDSLQRVLQSSRYLIGKLNVILFRLVLHIDVFSHNH